MRQPLSQSFKKGKETVKRKAKELSTLCDIPVCAVIVSPKGITETWPESPTEFKTIIDMYKEKTRILDHRDRDPAENDDVQRAEEEEDNEDELMLWLNTKIKSIENRIRVLKKMNEEDSCDGFDEVGIGNRQNTGVSALGVPTDFGAS